jgi:acyl carrier protein
MFKAVLGTEESVGPDTDFFDMGGNSLDAVQLVSKIRASVTDQISLRDLFESPTVAGISARLLELSSSSMMGGVHSIASIESCVREAFRSTLGLAVAPAGDTSFFESGGDSALAVQIIGSLRESVSDQVSLRDLFESPTVAGLTARLMELGAGGGGGASSLQAVVAAAFQQALGLDTAIDRNASFFESGGDSALAVQVIGSLRESVSDQVSLRDLFESPTVAGLTARLVELGVDGRPADSAVEPQLEPDPEMQPDNGDDVEQGTARRNRTIARLRQESPMSFRTTGDTGRGRPTMYGPSVDLAEP